MIKVRCFDVIRKSHELQWFVKEIRKGDIMALGADVEWSSKACNRLIESLLLGIPIGGVVAVRTQTMYPGMFVIDGVKRLQTIKMFMENAFPFTDSWFFDVKGQKYYYSDLPVKDRTRIDKTTIQLDIISGDYLSRGSIREIRSRINNAYTLEDTMAQYNSKIKRLRDFVKEVTDACGHNSNEGDSL